MRIIDLAQDPFADLARTADEIARDPALAARILRIANSPLYANVCRRPVTTLSQEMPHRQRRPQSIPVRIPVRHDQYLPLILQEIP